MGMKDRLETHSLRKQNPHTNTDEIWRTETRDACRLFLHRQVPFIPGSKKLHPESRQSSTVMAQTLLHGHDDDRSVDFKA